MKFLKRLVLSSFVTSVLLVYGCQEQKSNIDSDLSAVSIDSLFESYHQFKLRINPIEGTRVGIHKYDDVIVNYISKNVQEDLIVQYTNFLDEINSFDQNLLNESQLLSLKVMKWDCEIKKEGLSIAMSVVASPMFDLPNVTLLPINQAISFHLYFAMFADVGGAQPFNTVKDYENWLLRIDDFLIWLKTAQLNMQEGVNNNVVLPKVIIEKIIGQLEPFTNPSIEDHPFYAAIKNMPPEISDPDRVRLDKAYRKMISNELTPAYQELEEFLTTIYLPAGVETVGIGALPNGEDTYQYLIKLYTSTDMTPDEIFDLGHKEVGRILQEMEKVKDQVGFEGDLNTFFNHIRTSKDQMPFTDPSQVLQNFTSIHDRMKENLGNLFELTPKAAIEVRRPPAYQETSTSAYYLTGSKDGSRPGVFYVPIPDVTAYNKFSDESLFLHEAIPGHHYQLSLQQENDNLPEFLHAQEFYAYGEGWALYAESLGVELGLYEDPYQYFGMLSADMHRAIRLVVDIGLHAKGWTREEAINYSLEHEAMSEDRIISEIERYMVTPGYALSYKIGQLKIRELRTKAETVLGEKFDIKGFHKQVLNSGSLPLVLLEEKLNSWMEKQQSIN